MTKKLISKISFSEYDLDSFAKISGDFNKLHMDKIYAQIAGYENRVVYGALILIQALSFFDKLDLKNLRADFIEPIYCNYNYSIIFSYLASDKIEIRILDNLKTKSIIKVSSSNDIELNHILESVDGIILFHRVDINNFSFLKKNICEMSRKIGMVYPGPGALLRQISINKTTRDVKKVVGVSSKMKDLNLYSTSFKSGMFIFSGWSTQMEIISLKNKKNELRIFVSNSKPREVTVLVAGVAGALGTDLAILSALLGFNIIGVVKSVDARILELQKFIMKLGVEFTFILSSEIENYQMFTSRKIVVCYCSSPKIIPNSSDVNDILLQNYFDVYVEEMKILLRSINNVEGVFIPSTVMLEEFNPYKVRFKEYCKAKLAQESLILQMFNSISVLVIRFDYFKSRHFQIGLPFNHKAYQSNLKKIARWLNSF